MILYKYWKTSCLLRYTCFKSNWSYILCNKIKHRETSMLLLTRKFNYVWIKYYLFLHKKVILHKGCICWRARRLLQWKCYLIFTINLQGQMGKERWWWTIRKCFVGYNSNKLVRGHQHQVYYCEPIAQCKRLLKDRLCTHPLPTKQIIRISKYLLSVHASLPGGKREIKRREKWTKVKWRWPSF